MDFMILALAMETREGKAYTNEEGAESPKAFAGKGGVNVLNGGSVGKTRGCESQ